MENLPGPRKIPKQSRSRALVDAITQSCLRILDTEPPEALTIERLAEVSGVAVGSIYQYFSSKDGVIATVYERILEEEAATLHVIGESVLSMQVADALRLIFSNAIRVELRLNRLSKSFHRKYYKQLHLSEYYRKIDARAEPVEVLWIEFIDYFQKNLSPNDRRVVSSILARGYRSMIGELIDVLPDVIESDLFLDNLVLMALACLRYQPDS